MGWYIKEDEPKPYQLTIAETIPGPATDEIAAVAITLRCYIAFGMIEKRGEHLYNAQVLISPEGRIEAVHRKVNLTPEDELNGITPAPKVDSSVTVVHINNIKVGMIVCADVGSYWLTRKLIDQKVEVILHSMASEVPEFAIDPVSRQFNAWEVFANRYGRESKRKYSGTTFVADPAGTIRVSGMNKEMTKIYRIGVF